MTLLKHLQGLLNQAIIVQENVEGYHVVRWVSFINAAAVATNWPRARFTAGLGLTRSVNGLAEFCSGCPLGIQLYVTMTKVATVHPLEDDISPYWMDGMEEVPQPRILSRNAKHPIIVQANDSTNPPTE